MLVRHDGLPDLADLVELLLVHLVSLLDIDGLLLLTLLANGHATPFGTMIIDLEDLLLLVTIANYLAEIHLGVEKNTETHTRQIQWRHLGPHVLSDYDLTVNTSLVNSDPRDVWPTVG